ELGDLMLHILFYSRIAAEQGAFTLEEVMTGIADKLVATHPHIYGDVKGENEEDAKKNGEKLKLKEGKASVLSGVPASMPPMLKAITLQEKAKKVGFEWDHKEQVWEKVKEEEAEMMEAISLQVQEKMEEEFGDLVFSLINYARFLQIDAEAAL